MRSTDTASYRQERGVVKVGAYVSQENGQWLRQNRVNTGVTVAEFVRLAVEDAIKRAQTQEGEKVA